MSSLPLAYRVAYARMAGFARAATDNLMSGGSWAAYDMLRKREAFWYNAWRKEAHNVLPCERPCGNKNCNAV